LPIYSLDYLLFWCLILSMWQSFLPSSRLSLHSVDCSFCCAEAF
jgi:hypothetical protein